MPIHRGLNLIMQQEWTCMMNAVILVKKKLFPVMWQTDFTPLQTCSAVAEQQQQNKIMIPHKQ